MSDDLRDDQNAEGAAPAPQDETTQPDASEAAEPAAEAAGEDPGGAQPEASDAGEPAGERADGAASTDGDVEELASSALDAVTAALGEINAPDEAPPRDDPDASAAGEAAAPLDLPPLMRPSGDRERQDVSLISEVALHVTIELGRTRMSVEEVLQLGDGAVVELDKLAGDPVDIFVNGRAVARGEVLVLNENLCVRVSEILDPSAQRSGEPARRTTG